MDIYYLYWKPRGQKYEAPVGVYRSQEEAKRAHHEHWHANPHNRPDLYRLYYIKKMKCGFFSASSLEEQV